MFLGEYLADQDDKWTYLEPLIFLTLTLHDFSCKVYFKGVIYPLKYDAGKGTIDLMSDPVRDG